MATKSYNEAKKEAEKATLKTGIKKDYKGLTYNKEIGLTLSKKECAENGFEYPAYIARGRYDNGEYISIKQSSACNNFANGYYIIIANSGSKEETTETLYKVKKTFKPAYIKSCEVYMGCIH